MDADAELLFVLAPRGQREEATGLDNVLEDVLAGLEDGKNSRCLSPVSLDGEHRTRGFLVFVNIFELVVKGAWSWHLMTAYMLNMMQLIKYCKCLKRV